MASPSPPTVESLTAEVAALRASLATVTHGLSRAQFNWRPDGGTRWSIAQCLDHLAQGNAIYLQAIDEALDRAPARRDGDVLSARANTLGRWFVRSLEPPVRTRMKSPALIYPASDLDVAVTVQKFDATLARLVETMPRAWAVDVNRTRFRNPLAKGLRLFNLAAAFQILTAHGRRHLAQAAAVRARPDWPSV